MPSVPTPPRQVVSTVLAARQRMLQAADRLLPAHIALFQQSIGMGYTHVIGAIAELGVADELARGPLTAEQLAERLDVHADALHRLLRAATLGDVTKLHADGRFELGRNGQPLRSDHPHSMRSWARYYAFRSTTLAWAGLTESVRTGESAFPRVHGTSVWSWFAEHPEEERTFADCMRRLTEQDAPAVAAGYDWQGTVCDVAGGVGTLLTAILRTRPDLRGILVDAPGVLEGAEGHLSCAGVRERVELRTGDIFDRIDAAGADVYVLKDVLHDWDDERCTRILRTVRAAMSPGARILLVERLQERNVCDPIASLTDLQMLTQTDGGRQRSTEELHALMRGADIEPTGRMKRTAGPALVEGRA